MGGGVAWLWGGSSRRPTMLGMGEVATPCHYDFASACLLPAAVPRPG